MIFSYHEEKEENEEKSQNYAVLLSLTSKNLECIQYMRKWHSQTIKGKHLFETSYHKYPHVLI